MITKKAVIFSQPYLLEERSVFMDTIQDGKKMQYIKTALCVLFVLQVLSIIIILHHKVFSFAAPYSLGILLLCVFLKKSTGFDTLNACLNKTVNIGNLIRGFLFSFFPFFITWFFELLYLRLNGYKKMGINPRTPDIYFFGKSHPETIIMSVAFLVVYFVFVISSEIFFRGYVLRQYTKKFRSKKANIFQSFIYIVLTAPTVICYAFDREYRDAEILMKVLLIVCIVFNGLLASIKWGSLYYADGSVWMSIADHFVGGFLFCSVFACVEPVHVKLLFAQTLLYQFISCTLSYIYVRIRQKNKNKNFEKIKMINEVKLDQKEDILIELKFSPDTDISDIKPEEGENKEEEKYDEIAEVIKRTVKKNFEEKLK